MSLAPPSPRDMFADAQSAGEVAERFESYKAALTDVATSALAQHSRGELAFVPKQGVVKSASPVAAIEQQIGALTKGVNADQAAAAQAALEQLKAVTADLAKDWTLTNPLSTGLVPYDLKPVVQMLVPRAMPLRNSIPRTDGVGSAFEFRSITGVSNSGSGGVANLSTFFSSASASTAFGPVNLARPGKISYAATKKSIPYVEQGVSDEVLMQAQFAGRGYADARQLSHSAALWAHMLGEERNLLGARGTATGYAGLTGAPSAPTLAQSSGGALAASATYVKVTAVTGAGESTASTAATITPTLNNKVTVTPPTLPAGAVAYNVYASVTSGSEVLQGQAVAGAPFVITALATGTAALPGADTTASSLAYDGFVTAHTSASAGYVKVLGATLSTANPGTEFQAAFQSLYGSVLGDPEEVLLTAAIRVELSDGIKNQGNANGYRLNLQSDGAGGHQVGTIVSAIQNEVTGTMVNLQVHPYMPAGVALIRQRTLPIPDSGVSETAEVRNVQDMLVLDWPVIQMSYDISTYQYGALAHLALPWQGAIIGIL